MWNGGYHCKGILAGSRRQTCEHGRHYVHLGLENDMEPGRLGRPREMVMDQSNDVVRSRECSMALVQHCPQSHQPGQVFPNLAEGSSSEFLYGKDPEVGGSYCYNHSSRWTPEGWTPMDHQPISYSDHGTQNNRQTSGPLYHPYFDDVPMDYMPKSPSPSSQGSSVATLEASEPLSKLRPNIIDWESVDEGSIIARRNNFAKDQEGSEKSFASTAHSSDTRSGFFRSTYENIPCASRTYMNDLTDDWKKMEERQKRHRSMINGTSTFAGVDLKSKAAVCMPLDEVVAQNNIAYNRRTAWSSWRDGTSSSNNFGEHSKRKRSSDNSIFEPADTDEVFHSSSFHMRPKKNRREEQNAVIVDGTSLAFEYGDNFHFDWKGIAICVEQLAATGCADITVIVPEDRVLNAGMSKNEHFIEPLKKSKYLRLSWESRCEKRFAVKTALLRNAFIISNNVWTEGRQISPAWRHLRSSTFGFEFLSPSKIRFSTTLSGQSLEQALRIY